jgi:hypothetical protein
MQPLIPLYNVYKARIDWTTVYVEVAISPVKQVGIGHDLNIICPLTDTSKRPQPAAFRKALR